VYFAKTWDLTGTNEAKQKKIPVQPILMKRMWWLSFEDVVAQLAKATG
jgi:hypothetical protein